MITKSNPQIHDYNPLTHTRGSPIASSNDHTKWMSQTKFSQFQSTNLRENSKKLGETRSVFASSAAKGFSPQTSGDRFYKSKPKNEVFNPISGATQSFNGNWNSSSMGNTNKSSAVQLSPSKLQKDERISGALRKPVDNVGYFNPFTVQRSPMSDPNYVKACDNFYGK